MCVSRGERAQQALPPQISAGNAGGRGKSVGGIAPTRASFGFWEAKAGQNRPVQWPIHAPSGRPIAFGVARRYVLGRAESHSGNSGGKPGLNMFGETLVNDLVYALRLLKKARLSTFTIIITLALGIGASVAAFSLVSGVLFSPLPYPGANRIVELERAVTVGSVDPDASGGQYLFWAANQHTLVDVSAVEPAETASVYLRGHLRLVDVRSVTSDFFRLLGLPLATGRDFSSGGQQDTAILSYAMWTDVFNKDRTVVGQPLAISGRTYIVVGVASPRIDPTLSADVWTCLNTANDILSRENNLKVLARLKEGASISAARADLALVASHFRAINSNAMLPTESIAVYPYLSQIVKGSRQALLVVVVAVGLVLLIVCVNVANLLMARLMARRQEFGVRAAFGASEARILRQILTECLCLSGVACIVGLAIGRFAIGLSVKLLAGNFPRLGEVTMDSRVVLFTLVLTGVITVLFGTLPAIHSSKNLSNSLQETSTRSVGNRSKLYFRQVLITCELTLSTMLLVSSLLLVRSLLRLRQINPGFDPNRLTVLQGSFGNDTLVDAARFSATVNQVTSLMATVPGIEVTAASTYLPLVSRFRVPLKQIGGRESPGTWLGTVKWMAVTPGFFRVMRVPVELGRDFTESDTSAPVAVVNQAFARRYFPGERAIGQSLLLGWDVLGPEYRDDRRQIVGIVRDFRESNLESSPAPSVFVPISEVNTSQLQIASRMATDFLVRAKANESGHVAHELTTLVQEHVPRLAVEDVISMNEIMKDSVQSQRFEATVFSGFAGVALVLALVGVYGVVSYYVSERTAEIGMRMALGAHPRSVVRMIVWQGLRLGIIGAGVGLFGALSLGKLLQSLLYGVGPYDPEAVSVAVLAVISITTLASYLPAKRAGSMDVMTALRSQ